MRTGRLAAIILAGGFSSRMNRFKPLLPLGNRTFIEHIIDIYSQDQIDVIVVGGYRRDELFASVAGHNVTLAENPDYELGMFSSVVAGVRSLNDCYNAFFIQPVDIPLVKPSTIRCLMKASRHHPEKLVYPVFRGHRGHPPVIPKDVIPAILSWKGDYGLKGVLNSFGESAVDVPVADSGVVMDSDTPEDYQAILERYSRRDIPTDDEYQAIIEITNMTRDRIFHGQAVSEVAVSIARDLQQAGHDIDIDIVQASALLHDIAKGQSRHDTAGGDMLRDLGFERIADIVGLHTDLGGKPVTEPPLETRVLFLADKFVRDTRIVTLDERYRISQEQYAKDADIEKHIRQRKERALRVKRDIELLTGHPLEDILVFTGPG